MYAKVGESEFRAQEKRYKSCKDVKEAVSLGAIDLAAYMDIDIEDRRVDMEDRAVDPLLNVLNASTVQVFGKECQMVRI